MKKQLLNIKWLCPYVIKPLAEGSSVGVHVVGHGKNAPPENLLAEREIYGDNVMLERYIPGLELTCAVLADVALGVIEILPVEGFYDYKAKYEEGASKHVVPADVPAKNLPKNSAIFIDGA